jgi:hypothetical protein
MACTPCPALKRGCADRLATTESAPLSIAAETGLQASDI